MIIVFEIGSTTTLVNAFDGFGTDDVRFLGGGQAETTVLEGDVTIGLKNALSDLSKQFEVPSSFEGVFATSSAAGGLKMTVHGLVHDMTVKAAKEAALGAGANIRFITSGKLRRTDLKHIQEIQPNIILLAGGVDFGERDTALYNAEEILKLDLNVPVIYAGNIQNQDEVRLMFEEAGKSDLLFVTENVYPSIDELNVEPTRKIIQQVFERHITEAMGMEKVREIVTGNIIPTPGSVMLATELYEKAYGDVITIDVGGATTDVHSVTDGLEEISKIQIQPEPRAKRTVEGDLGLFVSRLGVAKEIPEKIAMARLGSTPEELNERVQNLGPIPKTEEEVKLASFLCEVASVEALNRHAGGIKKLYYTTGNKAVAIGKDLGAVQTIIGTGGALTRLPKMDEMLKDIHKQNHGDRLFPKEGYKVYLDHDYIMASLGVLSMAHPEDALKLLKKSLHITE
ncbi:GlmL-related ornithine degradation protein [Guggenheimella bovis]